ncbi:MAG: nuclear transport factor 2 family protein [Planctomycetota bacterium]|nr:nuclear transport factor 2 family protein [Planctomycetota bacterium]
MSEQRVRRAWAWAALGAGMLLMGCATDPTRERELTPAAVAILDESARRTLTAFHEAAARADEAAYFALLDDDAVFLGTDASERWSKEAFRAYAHPAFAQGKGWTYRERATNVRVTTDTAWFDQELVNEKYGTCRGTGVMRRRWSAADRRHVWRISQYSLSVPIPNEMLADVARQIRENAATAKTR